jgi:hypothetical protein
MESMSWSDDTRCLYCEGRLPLYRKVTHGQFCSSAHRKSYWQEQERLAIERLHQTHSSLRSYRPPAAPELHQELQHLSQEGAPYPELESAAQARVVTGLAPDSDLETVPNPVFEENPYPLPNVGEPSVPASELLSFLAHDLSGFSGVAGSAPELIAADPFEYEITLQPLPPSHGSVLRTRPLPEGLPIAARSYLGPWRSNKEAASGTIETSPIAASLECDLNPCQPSSQALAVGIRAAGRVGLPLVKALETRRPAIETESALQILEMKPAPVTSVELKVRLQSDVLLQLLDQQVPHPDRMLSLGQFAAHQPTFALACPGLQQFDAAVDAALPRPSEKAIAADYQLKSLTEMLQLPAAAPVQGTTVIGAAISEIALNPQTGISAVMPAVASVHQMGMAGLCRLSNTLLPVQGAYSLQGANSQVFDFSTGVSLDVCYPRMAGAAASAQTPVFTRILPLTFGKKRKSAGDVPRIDPIARLLPESVEMHPTIPSSGLEPLDRKPAGDGLRAPSGGIGSLIRGEGLRTLEPAWAHATGFWQHAPRDLKLLLFAIPALLALYFHPGWPQVALAAPQPSAGLTGNFKRVLNTQWVSVRQTLEKRAAVALDEDFRSGLDNWASPGGSTTEWSFDATGFVRPGPLALYRPSVNLTDYHLEFVGLIDKKAMSWVVRAADFENFYVIKLVVVKPGPMPVIGLTRYAVVNGKARDRHDVNIPLSARADTVYNVHMDVHGSDFSVEVQGQMADSWTETRLPRGGIGFFTASGEASRLRWMQITHQYDMLGRLCAYLAPYDTTNGSWQP